MENGKNAFVFWEQGLLGDLYKGSAVAFSNRLRSILYFLSLHSLLTPATVKHIEQRLALDKGWSHLHKNGDETLTCYIGYEVWDTFESEELIAWIIVQMLKDPLMQEANETKDYAGLVKILKGLSIPMDWDFSFISIKDERIDNFLFTDSHFFWAEKNEAGVYSVYRSRFDKSFSSLLTLDKNCPIYEGVHSDLMYDKSGHAILCKMIGRDCYARYDYKNIKEKLFYDARLIGVGKDGEIWYEDRQGKICSHISRHKDKKFDVEYGSEYQIAQDGGIIVLPSERSLQAFKPYCIKSDGSREPCSQLFAKRHLWKLILKDVLKEDILLATPHNFTEVLQWEQLWEAPYPFTAFKMLTALQKLKKDSLVKPNSVNGMCSLLMRLVNKGGLVFGDCTDLLYSLWKVQKLCMKKSEHIFDKQFVSFALEWLEQVMLNQIDMDTVESLLQEQVYWTPERIDRQISKAIKERNTKPEADGQLYKIGSFYVEDSRLHTELDYVSNGLIMDRLIVKSVPKDDEGCVYFDRKTKRYSAIWHKEFKAYFEDLKKCTGIQDLLYDYRPVCIEEEEESDLSIPSYAPARIHFDAPSGIQEVPWEGISEREWEFNIEAGFCDDEDPDDLIIESLINRIERKLAEIEMEELRQRKEQMKSEAGSLKPLLDELEEEGSW